VFATVTPSYNSFNTGEVSPLMEDRVDFPKYDSSCKQLENMLVLSQGPVTRRQGTKYIAEVNDSNDIACLFSFQYSVTDTYAIEAGDEYFRFYRRDPDTGESGVILDGNNPYEISTEYLDDEVFEIQYTQNGNTMYIVHPNHPPAALTRTAHTNWDLNDIDIDNGPFMGENKTSTTITPSDTTGNITLVADSNIFQSTHVGALWRISQPLDDSTTSKKLDQEGETSSEIRVFGDYTFKALENGDSFIGKILIEREERDSGSWEEVWAFEADSETDQFNVEYEGTETETGVKYRFKVVDYSAGDSWCTFRVHDTIWDGYVRITEYIDAKDVCSVVLTDLESTDATNKWSEGAWSDYRGWPRTVDIHERRLVFAGNEAFVQTIWFGAVEEDENGDFNDFAEGTDDNRAFTFVIPNFNPVQWLLSQDWLFVGTLAGVGRYGDIDETTTPTTPKYSTQASDGSEYIQSVIASNTILYVERAGERVREYAYSYTDDKHISNDMTILSEHIAKGGIVDMAYQSRPDSILWCVRDDGVLLSLTYQRSHEVIAWARHITDGLVESVCVIPGDDEDEVWLIVNRTIDGTTRKYVEQLQDIYWGSDQTDCFYVDCGISFDGGDAVNVSDVNQLCPAVVTVSSWPEQADGTALADGDNITFESVGGMTELNNNVYTVNEPNVSDLTFQLRDSSDVGDINSVGFTAYTSGGTCQIVEKNFTNLSHLEGETISIFADGTPLGTESVSSGSCSIDNWSNKVHFGMPYTSILETMPIVFDLPNVGTVAAMKKRIVNVAVDFYNTQGAYIGTDEDNLNVMNFDDEDGDGATDLYTGYKKSSFQHGWQDDKTTVYIELAEPSPLTIRQIVTEVDIIK